MQRSRPARDSGGDTARCRSPALQQSAHAPGLSTITRPTHAWVNG